MNTTLLEQKFNRIGARLKVVDRFSQNSLNQVERVRLDVREDRHGEFFEIRSRIESTSELVVLDTQPTDRHLLLLVREGGDKSKFLCGHDERHWFVAGIPEAAPVGTVRQAKQALQPAIVRTAVGQKGVSGNALNRRKNSAFIRQGEWFFLPVVDFTVRETLILKNEPLRRSNRGKPHWAEYCYRTGGETVYVCNRYPAGVNSAEYRKILGRNSDSARWGWRTMRRNPRVYVKGRIRHADHATVTLHGWHQVVMNTENESRAMRNVAFLD